MEDDLSELKTWREFITKIVENPSPSIHESIYPELKSILDEPDDAKARLMFMKMFDFALMDRKINTIAIVVFNSIIGLMVYGLSLEERNKFEQDLMFQREAFLLRN